MCFLALRRIDRCQWAAHDSRKEIAESSLGVRIRAPSVVVAAFAHPLLGEPPCLHMPRP